MLQPQDPLEPASVVRGGGGSGCGEHRPGSRRHQLGSRALQASAGGRISGLEWTLCTSQKRSDCCILCIFTVVVDVVAGA